MPGQCPGRPRTIRWSSSWRRRPWGSPRTGGGRCPVPAWWGAAAAGLVAWLLPLATRPLGAGRHRTAGCHRRYGCLLAPLPLVPVRRGTTWAVSRGRSNAGGDRGRRPANAAARPTPNPDPLEIQARRAGAAGDRAARHPRRAGLAAGIRPGGDGRRRRPAGGPGVRPAAGLCPAGKPLAADESRPVRCFGPLAGQPRIRATSK